MSNRISKLGTFPQPGGVQTLCLRLRSAVPLLRGGGLCCGTCGPRWVIGRRDVVCELSALPAHCPTAPRRPRAGVLPTLRGQARRPVEGVPVADARAPVLAVA